MSRVESSTAAPGSTVRWLQLVAGIICMVMIANLQYGWTLFVSPIDEKYHWGRAAIQVAFTIFVLTETWLVPVEGWLVDRFGPKIVVFVGGVLVAIAWMMNSAADTLTTLYIAAALGGIGAGGVYGTCIGNALKWFPDRRGLAAGLTAAGFGAGSALTIIPIQGMIQASGYEATFLWFGIGQGLVVVALSLTLRPPRVGEAPPSTRLKQSARDYTPLEVLASPIFWIMYAMFVLVGAGGLMATAQLAPIAYDFQIAKVPVSLLGLTLPALTFALSIDRVLNGLTRPFFGWVSDRIGRENTMFIAFGLEALDHCAALRDGVEVAVFAVGVDDARPVHGQRVDAPLEAAGMIVGAAHAAVRARAGEPVRVRARDRSLFRGLRRDLQPVSGNLRRYLRQQIRNDQQRHALHGEGHRLAACPPRQCAGGGEWWLAFGVHPRGIDERRGSNYVSCRAETVAGRARQRHRRNALSPGSTPIEARGSRLPFCAGPLPVAAVHCRKGWLGLVVAVIMKH